jgi:hypothetical protein
MHDTESHDDDLPDWREIVHETITSPETRDVSNTEKEAAHLLALLEAQERAAAAEEWRLRAFKEGRGGARRSYVRLKTGYVKRKRGRPPGWHNKPDVRRMRAGWQPWRSRF